MSTTEHVPMVATRADRPAPMNRLPIDGATLETRLAGDYLGVSELIKMLFAALMLESSNRCYELMQECGDLFHHATESDFVDTEGLAAQMRLLYRLVDELDFYNYRIDLVKTATRHR